MCIFVMKYFDLFEVCLCDLEYVALYFVQIYEVFPQSLLDVSRAVLS